MLPELKEPIPKVHLDTQFHWFFMVLLRRWKRSQAGLVVVEKVLIDNVGKALVVFKAEVIIMIIICYNYIATQGYKLMSIVRIAFTAI